MIRTSTLIVVLPHQRPASRHCFADRWRLHLDGLRDGGPRVSRVAPNHAHADVRMSADTEGRREMDAARS